jgi:hypothetical protein
MKTPEPQIVHPKTDQCKLSWMWTNKCCWNENACCWGSGLQHDSIVNQQHQLPVPMIGAKMMCIIRFASKWVRSLRESQQSKCAEHN